MEDAPKIAESEWTWMCRECGTVNFHGETHCKRCGQERRNPAQEADGQSAQRAGEDGCD